MSGSFSNRVGTVPYCSSGFSPGSHCHAIFNRSTFRLVISSAAEYLLLVGSPPYCSHSTCADWPAGVAKTAAAMRHAKAPV